MGKRAGRPPSCDATPEQREVVTRTTHRNGSNAEAGGAGASRLRALRVRHLSAAVNRRSRELSLAWHSCSSSYPAWALFPHSTKRSAPGPQAHVLTTGIQFGEQPRWHEGRLWFSDWGTREVMALDLEGNHEVILRAPAFPCCVDWLPDGRLLVV